MTKKALRYFFYVLTALMFNVVFANAGISNFTNVLHDESCILSSNDAQEFGFKKTYGTLPTKYGESQTISQNIIFHTIAKKLLKDKILGTIISEYIVKNNDLHYYFYAKNISISLSIQTLLFPFHSFW
jgi:hypothetical protein